MKALKAEKPATAQGEPASETDQRDSAIGSTHTSSLSPSICIRAERARVPPTKAESSDEYPVIAKLNARWRVIACRHGIQWILQYRNRAETVARDVWRGRSYCRTSEALIRCTREYCGPIEPAAAAILAALPAWIEPAAASTGGSSEILQLMEDHS